MTKPKRTPDIPRAPAARRAWIRYQLTLRGLTFEALARELGVSGTAVRSAATGYPIQRIEMAIADAINVPARTLFPEHYGPDGTRAPDRTKVRNRTAHAAQGNARNGAVHAQTREVV